ncbi:MAG: hypothetical protein BMS9Abin37_1442 [Acidobacteriota bacterium]|nr:MAG: hypothetical protein BMS9Abin37_1442 [Acidobacteriota bacterium]
MKSSPNAFSKSDAIARQYDLFQASLESLGKESKYLNYGYTTSREETYEQCQERLCLEVFHAAAIEPQHVVVDVGFGSGEQDFLLIRTGSFKHLYGFNIAAKQVAYATARAREEKLDDKMSFQLGAAETLSGIAPGSVDRVIAIECAFYFDRPRFYQRTAEVLRPGGLLVLADIMFADRMAFFASSSEDLSRVGTESSNRDQWSPYFQPRSIRRINRQTRPGAQMTVSQILKIAPFSGFNAQQVREWLKMAFYSQLVALGLYTHLLHYDLVVLEKC